MTCAFEIRGTGFVWRMLENSLPPNVKDAVKGMRLCKDSMVHVKWCEVRARERSGCGGDSAV